MSQDSPEDSFRAVTAAWIDNHTYVVEEDQALAVILIATEVVDPNDDTSSLLQVDCGFGYFQVQGYYDSFDDKFDCTAAILVVPWFGPIAMASNVVFELKNSDSVSFNFGEAGRGKFKIEYNLKEDQVVFKYDLKIPFISTGNLQDTIPLFPVNPTSTSTTNNLKTISRKVADVRAIRSSKQKKRLITSNPSSAAGVDGDTVISDHFMNVAQTERVKLLNIFLTDSLKDDHKIVIQTSRPDTTSSGTDDAVTSKGFSISIHFAAILELVATINPDNLYAAAKLFVSVPIAGRVEVVDVSGFLVDGSGVTAQFDAVVASGKITLYAKANNDDSKKHDLYVSFSLTIALVGTIAQDDFRLITLP